MTRFHYPASAIAVGLVLSGCAARVPLSQTVPAIRPAIVDPFVPTIESMKHSVAPVICMDRDGPQSTVQHLEGTAFFISQAGDFLTAAHVIDGIRTHTHPCPVIAIYLPPDHWKPEVPEEVFEWYPFSAAACTFHRDLDVAKCKPGTDLSTRAGKSSFEIQPVKFEWSSQPDGTLIAFTGFPLGSRDPLTSRGGIAQYRRAPSDDLIDLVIDQSAWPGASGAPVYLSDGRVVGIVLARGIEGGTGTAVVRPAQFLQRILDAEPRFTESAGFRRVKPF